MPNPAYVNQKYVDSLVQRLAEAEKNQTRQFLVMRAMMLLKHDTSHLSITDLLNSVVKAEEASGYKYIPRSGSVMGHWEKL